MWGTLTSHVLAGTHHFIDQQELLGQYWSDVHELTFDHVVVPYSCDSSWKSVSSIDVNTICLLVFYVGLLDLQDSLLSIKAGVLGQSSWHDEESISESIDSQLGLTRNAGSGELHQLLVASNFESTSSWNQSFIFYGVLDGSKSISDSLFGLSN